MIDTAPPTIDEEMARFTSHLLTARGFRPATVRGYVRETRGFLRWLDGRESAAEPGSKNWLNHMATAIDRYNAEHPAAASTITGRLAAIKRYYRGFLKLPDPTDELERPKRPKGIPHPIEDVEAVIRRIRRPYNLIAIMLLESGMRVGEAERLTPADLVDIGGPAIHIVMGKGGKDRIVPVGDRFVAAFRALGGSVPVKARAIQRAFHREGTHPHAFRHTYATRLRAAGVPLEDIQVLLGHASPATTQIYAAWNMDALRAAINRVSGPKLQAIGGE